MDRLAARPAIDGEVHQWTIVRSRRCRGQMSPAAPISDWCSRLNRSSSASSTTWRRGVSKQSANSSKPAISDSTLSTWQYCRRNLSRILPPVDGAVVSFGCGWAGFPHLLFIQPARLATGSSFSKAKQSRQIRSISRGAVSSLAFHWGMKRAWRVWRSSSSMRAKISGALNLSSPTREEFSLFSLRDSLGAESL